MITPLSNTLLFEDQPGLVAPSVTVNKQVTGRCLLTIVNNTGKTFNVKNNTVIVFIEHLHRTDLVEPCTYNSTHTSIVNAKNRQHFHTNNISNHNVSNINKQDKLDCSDKENELDIVNYSSLINMLNKHRKLFIDDIRNLKQTNILQATFNTEQNTGNRILPRRKQPDRRVKISRPQSEWTMCGMKKIHQRIQLMKKYLRSKKTSYSHAL